MTTLVLVHSPLVGPASWSGVAARLRTAGRDAVVPDLRPALTDAGPRVERQVLLATAAVPAAAPVVLIAHSGAGALVPAIGARLAETGHRVAAQLYVDAGLPHPGRSRLDTLPPELAAHLAAIAVGDVLPPWPSWWPPEELAASVAEPARSELIADCPPLPMDLFTEPMPALGLLEVPGGYVQLSGGYQEEADAAARIGWPVRGLDADHLAVLTDPETVAVELLALLGHLTPDRPE